MKPYRLTIQSFGSYQQCTTIDFSMVQSGLFLIHGATGSGKTTIFDAICFALYGKTSGNIKSGLMLQNDFIRDLESFVELEFIQDGHHYTVKRKPMQQRFSKRKVNGEKGLVTDNESVMLYDENHQPFHGKNDEINARIIALIGINKNEFDSLSMIAQGRFIELLQADSKKRKAIFKDLFDTHIYSRLTDTIVAKVAQLKKTVIDNQRFLDSQLDQLRLDETIDASMMHINAASFLDTYQTWKIQSEKSIEKDAKAMDQLNTTMMEMVRQSGEAEKHNQMVQAYHNRQEIQKQDIKDRSRIDQLRHKLEVHHQYSGLLPYYNQYQQALKARERESSSLNLAKNMVETRKKELDLTMKAYDAFHASYQDQRDELIQCKNQINALMVSLEKRIQAKQEMDGLTKDIAELTDQITHGQTSKQSIEDQIKRAKNYADQLSELTEKRHSLLDQQKTWLDQIKAIETIIQAIQSLDQQTSELNQKRNEYAHLKGKWLSAKDVVTQMESQYLDQQAGLLAASLQDGKPCPVCGSTTHPNKAILSDKAISESELEYAKEKENQWLNQCQSLVATIEQMDATIKTKTSLYTEQLIALGEREFNLESLKNRIHLLNVDLSKLAQDLDRVEADLVQSRNGKEALIVLEDKLKGITSKLDQLNAKKQEMTSKLNGATTRYQLADEALDHKDQSSIETQHEAIHTQLLSLENQAKQLENEKNAIQAKYDQAHQHYHQVMAKDQAARSQIDTLHQQLVKQYEVYGIIDDAYLLDHVMDETTYHNVVKTIEDYDGRVRETNALLSQYRRYLDGNENIMDTSSFESTIASYKSQIAALQRSITDRTTMLQFNAPLIASIAALDTTIKKDTQQLSMVEPLALLVDGKCKSAPSLDLETFVQRQYFNAIVSAANRRLSQMNVSFSLATRSIDNLRLQGEVGLDLDVINNATLVYRDVKTLSGGESFMAALAMAFGMSDVVMAGKGKVKLEMIFIDEGFGALDETARTDALRLLSEMARDYRMIGIISHVDALKETIKHQLGVSKGIHGSTIQWEHFV